MIQLQQISIVPVSTENDLAPIRHLFRAYVDWLGIDLSYQGTSPSVGGEMVHVQENMAKLPASDREAIAAYLKAIPPVAPTAN